MYFPYLRGKQFELEALTEVSSTVFSNTLPILEPINLTSRAKGLYDRIAGQGVPLILIINPYYGSLTIANVQNLIDTNLANHQNLIIGFLIDERFSLADLNAFLTSNSNLSKSLIFRHDPFPAELAAINSAILANSVDYILFDDTKVSNQTKAAFINHPRLVLISNGFQRKSRNRDYQQTSAFNSNFETYRNNGWFGIGDYLTIGDYFSDGGGATYIVTLHITRHSPKGLITHHFSSTYQSKTKGLTAPKFAEANSLLVTNPNITPLSSSGLTLYRGWHNTKHNPQLGAAKKASMMHHIELMSSLI
ncbi:sce7725 family protein [Mucilaginibacter sp. UR6-1]|uniref:sce7725 family protein n=1 Tax=Mucilaginibacter sp. UR6-1 TaxID=1435643 RepID=UPI001E54B6AF|nr:sce7725 family protein [Mucilaginibacter sp. UR6-1]MCC8410000.1 sce7725 family protein [Mucilaginibacter sp. UR6-1]